MRKAWLVGVVWLLVGGSAQASTVITPESATSYPYQRWVVRGALPTPPIAVQVLEEACPFLSGVSACTEPGGPIYMDPAAFGSIPRTKATFMHELGHQYDYTRLTDANRARFMSIYGLPEPWYQPGNLDYSTNPAERFADRYSILALLRGEDQSRDQMHAVRRMIRAIG